MQGQIENHGTWSKDSMVAALNSGHETVCGDGLNARYGQALKHIWWSSPRKLNAGRRRGVTSRRHHFLTVDERLDDRAVDQETNQRNSVRARGEGHRFAAYSDRRLAARPAGVTNGEYRRRAGPQFQPARARYGREPAYDLTAAVLDLYAG
jgi:hypothetical protein